MTDGGFYFKVEGPIRNAQKAARATFPVLWTEKDKVNSAIQTKLEKFYFFREMMKRAVVRSVPAALP